MEDGVAFLFAALVSLLVYLVLVPASFFLATPVILLLALRERGAYAACVKRSYRAVWRFWFRSPFDLLTWVP